MKCVFGRHDLNLVAKDSRCAWTNAAGETQHKIVLSFYACACCGKRKAGKLSLLDKRHQLAPALLERWLRSGHLDDRVERIHPGTDEVHTLRLVKS